jgi:hypothetical protein
MIFHYDRRKFLKQIAVAGAGIVLLPFTLHPPMQQNNDLFCQVITTIKFIP